MSSFAVLGKFKFPEPSDSTSQFVRQSRPARFGAMINAITSEASTYPLHRIDTTAKVVTRRWDLGDQTIEVDQVDSLTMKTSGDPNPIGISGYIEYSDIVLSMDWIPVYHFNGEIPDCQIPLETPLDAVLQLQMVSMLDGSKGIKVLKKATIKKLAVVAGSLYITDWEASGTPQELRVYVINGGGLTPDPGDPLIAMLAEIHSASPVDLSASAYNAVRFTNVGGD